MTFQNKLFKKFFQEHYQSVKQFLFKNILSALIWIQSVRKFLHEMSQHMIL